LKQMQELSQQQAKDMQTRLFELLKSLIQKSDKILLERSSLEYNNKAFAQVLSLTSELEASLDQLSHDYLNSNNNQCDATLLASGVMYISQQLIALYEQANFVTRFSPDIERSEVLSNKLRELCLNLHDLHQPLLSPSIESATSFEATSHKIKRNLGEIKLILPDLMKTIQNQMDLDDMVKKELNEMEKAIQEAAKHFEELLSATRTQDQGIQLEVNEKILDACTQLMDFIKQLIKKSIILQDEIVSIGRGKSSAKEFYKRNSHWTEGLISASKSVAKGANLLVAAANRAVTSSGPNSNFEIIVAAQEIAACTAQLVIASKVKAPKDSNKLNDLTQASRNVSKATGTVVATVRSCNQHLEQAQEVDITKLTASQSKAMEMEINVKILELEQALEMERRKLTSFRRQNYQSIED